MASTSKDGSSLRKLNQDPRADDAWKQSPSTEVTDDQGVNAEPVPDRTPTEDGTINPDKQAPGGDPPPR